MKSKFLNSRLGYSRQSLVNRRESAAAESWADDDNKTENILVGGTNVIRINRFLSAEEDQRIRD